MADPSDKRRDPEGRHDAPQTLPPDTPVGRDADAGGEPLPATTTPSDLKVAPTRVSAAWAGVLAAVVVLVLLLVFILENGHSVKVSYFGASGHLPLGVALLLAAVGGALIIGIVGVARLSQLRLTARRHRRSHTQPR
jgi:uncharacterized integral membrane protein